MTRRVVEDSILTLEMYLNGRTLASLSPEERKEVVKLFLLKKFNARLFHWDAIKTRDPLTTVCLYCGHKRTWNRPDNLYTKDSLDCCHGSSVVTARNMNPEIRMIQVQKHCQNLGLRLIDLDCSKASRAVKFICLNGGCRGYGTTNTHTRLDMFLKTSRARCCEDTDRMHKAFHVLVDIARSRGHLLLNKKLTTKNEYIYT